MHCFYEKRKLFIYKFKGIYLHISFCMSYVYLELISLRDLMRLWHQSYKVFFTNILIYTSYISYFSHRLHQSKFIYLAISTYGVKILSKRLLVYFGDFIWNVIILFLKLKTELRSLLKKLNSHIVRDENGRHLIIFIVVSLYIDTLFLSEKVLGPMINFSLVKIKKRYLLDNIKLKILIS